MVAVGWLVGETVMQIDGVAPLVANPTDGTPPQHCTGQNPPDTEQYPEPIVKFKTPSWIENILNM